MWYAGIDWADRHHEVVVLDAAGTCVGRLHVVHSAQGIEQLLDWLRQIVEQGAPAGASPDLEQMACLIETSHGLLITALVEAGFAVYPVNPRTVGQWRRPAGAKTDAIDALLLAKKGRSDCADLRRLVPQSPLVQELKVLTRDQDSLIQEQTRLLNQLMACLKQYYPVALALFTKLAQPLTLRFLQRYPTLEAAQAATVEELAGFLVGQVPGYRAPHAAATRLWQQLQQPQLRADAITTRTQARHMQALVSQLCPLLEQIAAYDEEISRLFRLHPDSGLFSTLPGAGRRLAPRLLAEWGDDRTRYAEAASVQALAGTAPVPYRSGQYARAHQRRACLKPLRNALYQWAWHSLRQESWARTYYERKRHEGKRHSMALRALANIWVRILYKLWISATPYDPAIFHAAQQAHASRAA